MRTSEIRELDDGGDWDKAVAASLGVDGAPRSGINAVDSFNAFDLTVGQIATQEGDNASSLSRRGRLGSRCAAQHRVRRRSRDRGARRARHRSAPEGISMSGRRSWLAAVCAASLVAGCSGSVRLSGAVEGEAPPTTTAVDAASFQRAMTRGRRSGPNPFVRAAGTLAIAGRHPGRTRRWPRSAIVAS